MSVMCRQILTMHLFFRQTHTVTTHTQHTPTGHMHACMQETRSAHSYTHAHAHKHQQHRLVNCGNGKDPPCVCVSVTPSQQQRFLFLMVYIKIIIFLSLSAAYEPSLLYCNCQWRGCCCVGCALVVHVCVWISVGLSRCESK